MRNTDVVGPRKAVVLARPAGTGASEHAIRGQVAIDGAGETVELPPHLS